MPEETVGQGQNAHQEKPSIPYASIKKLKAIRHWAIERRRLGLDIDDGQLNAAEMTRTLSRMDYEDKLKVNKVEAPPLPDKFVSFGEKWRPFGEGFEGHLAVARGVMNIPLAYIVREIEVPTNEMRNKTYDTSDDRLIALVVLAGEEYEQDNARVWDMLRPLIYGTSAWSFVKQYNARKNGRMAYLTLKLRGEGEAVTDARRAKADETIRTIKYTGTSKRFTVQTLVNVLQNAFTEKELCGEALTEKRKVEILAKALQAPRLSNVRYTIMSNTKYRADFQEAYAFIETMEQFDDAGLTMDKGGPHRNVSETTGKKGDHSYRPPDVWAKLTPKEKKRIQEKRKDYKAKKNKGDQNSEAKGKDAFASLKRKMAEVATETLERMMADGKKSDKAGSGGSQGGSGEERSKKRQKKGSPSDQFGRQAHALMKMRDAMAAFDESDDE